MMPLRATAAVAAALMATGAMAEQYLLIMESAPRGTGRRIGRLFDPHSGFLVRDLFIDAAEAGMEAPVEAALVEDEIWVNDQIGDALFRFDLDGSFLGVITGGMDNIRGIEYVDGVVYVTNAGEGGGAPGKAVVMFDADGNNLGSWPAGNPLDVVAFDGDLMIGDITENRLDLYRRNGEFIRTFSAPGINFPEQIAIKASDGNVLAGGYMNPSGIYEYDRDTGAQVNYWPESPTRGVHELGNGQILFTNTFGVHTLDPRSGAVTLITPEGNGFIALVDTRSSAGPCYADCDDSGELDFFDFLCFQNEFAAGCSQSPTWQRIPAETVGDAENSFFGLHGTSSSDIWAVGQAVYSVPGGTREYQTLIEHFDGEAWTDAEAPNPGGFTGSHDLWDVVAVAPDEAWAVGSYVPPTILTVSQPLMLRWDGDSWDHVPGPIYMGGGSFQGASLIEGEIWAAGTRAAEAPDALFRGNLVRWDGSDWRDELLPRFAMCGRFGDQPRAIDGVSSSDVWVVGSAQEGATCGGFPPTRYVAHYDGSEWKLVDAPWPTEFNILHDVEAIASDDVWAVGYYTDFASSSQQPFIIHWDGGRWDMVDLPPFPAGGAITWSVTARAADDVFVAGAVLGSTGLPRPLVMHYDGSQWSVMDTDGDSGQFRAVSALPSGDVWAVGQPQLTARLQDQTICDADCDGSASLDFFDFLCFQNAFAAGCP